MVWGEGGEAFSAAARGRRGEKGCCCETAGCGKSVGALGGQEKGALWWGHGGGELLFGILPRIAGGRRWVRAVLRGEGDSGPFCAVFRRRLAGRYAWVARGGKAGRRGGAFPSGGCRHPPGCAKMGEETN